MNWSLIIKLSLFAILLGVVSVFVNIAGVETWIWLAWYAICAFILAKQTTKHLFAHGFMLGLFSTVLLTMVHLLMFEHYMVTNAESYKQMSRLPQGITIKTAIIMISAIVAIGAGLIAGLMSFLAGLIVKPKVSE